MNINKKSVLTFLEACKVLNEKNIEKLPQKSVNIVSSSQWNQFFLYLKAYYSKKGFNLIIDSIDFGTLKQYLLNNTKNKVNYENILFLLPWDFLESFNWRTGISQSDYSIDYYKNEIDKFKELCLKKKFKSIFFIDAKVPIICNSLKLNFLLRNYIQLAAREISAHFIEEEFFSMKNFLSSGYPLDNKKNSELALNISNILENDFSSKKIIFLDLDNTLWKGVLGEDGVNGINANQDEIGYVFFIFQTFLKKLKNNGILLAIVTKNDEDLVKEAFRINKFPLEYDDFVAIIATYKPKSLQIKKILKNLNLLPEASIFIDDNELEIYEVSKSEACIECIHFKYRIDQIPDLIDKVYRFFKFETISDEDINRTRLYKKKLSFFEVQDGNKEDLSFYLKSLNSTLKIRELNNSEISRAVQLINKTNEFNLNGIRRTQEEVEKLMESNHRIISGELVDKNGTHGEVIVILLSLSGEVKSFVMSCRIFQRMAEYAFIGALPEYQINNLFFKFVKNKRNSPFLEFLNNIGKSNNQNIELKKSEMILIKNKANKLLTTKILN